MRFEILQIVAIKNDVFLRFLFHNTARLEHIETGVIGTAQ